MSSKDLSVSECDLSSHSAITNKPGNRKNLKKCTKRIRLSNTEYKLYKKIAELKLKVSKSKYRKKKHKFSLKTAQRLTRSMTFAKMMDNFTSATKILTMLKFGGYENEGKPKVFDLRDKITALSIYKNCPQSYGFLCQIFSLPSPKELMSFPESKSPLITKRMFVLLKRMAIDRGADMDVNSPPEILKMRKNLTPENRMVAKAFLKRVASKMWVDERLCVVLFDEISIKPYLKKDEITDDLNLPDHCLVFMIRGIQQKYLQPIAYSFSVGPTKAIELAKIIKNVINDLQVTKFIPLATICNERGYHKEALKYLVDETKKYFQSRGETCEKNVFYVNNEEIIPLYDPPNLLKSVRNHFLTKNIKHSYKEKNCVAKWEHLVLLYETCPLTTRWDGKKERIIPNLTKYHVIPEKINKRETRYACEVLSHRKAAFMNMEAVHGKLPKEAQQTAYLLLFFDKLFDSVNGSKADKYKDYKPLLSAVKLNSLHHRYWKIFIEELKSMEFVGPHTKEVTTLKNWIWTLEGFELLTRKLECKYKKGSLWMRQFNLDKLEHYLLDVRSIGRKRVRSRASAFKMAFASWFAGDLSIRI